jgi:hypothetical protein
MDELQIKQRVKWVPVALIAVLVASVIWQFVDDRNSSLENMWTLIGLLMSLIFILPFFVLILLPYKTLRFYKEFFFVKYILWPFKEFVYSKNDYDGFILVKRDVPFRGIVNYVWIVKDGKLKVMICSDLYDEDVTARFYALGMKCLGEMNVLLPEFYQLGLKINY